ncbi:N-acetylmuramoyl-L-alanine amidase [Brevibacterium sp. BDJS002]|uniref:peptidoglycan recognition protein family protein n=1 Tax=Brevibacterium sp. BDJS002 TaxID=3020906 RepID=UPI002306E05E|nr:N-acetylmuramoyl-L-alanine amidase [Brevibacterium sp. BDJS002]WCE39108.1 N-acetylmuramoyl-L-alanine amidase [Brevibacterium sp. BDJS002]
MAMMPGAVNRLLANQARQGRMKSYDAACLHTMVGSLAGTDGMFQKNGTVGTESHFGVGGDGTIYQWVDTKYTADANYLGSGHVISIETADHGPEFKPWNTRGDNVPAWTPAQIKAIVKILVWVHKTHGIPLRATTSVTQKGVGYHRQGVPGNGLPSHLMGTKYQWSKYRGKVCPGDRRIAQIPGIVKQAETGTTSTTEPKGILGMSKYIYSKPYKAIQKLAHAKWQTLWVGRGATSILTFDGSSFMSEASLVVSGLKPGESLQVRFFIASYEKGTKTKHVGYYSKQEFVGTTGGTYVVASQIGKRGKGRGGRSERLRAQVWTNSKTAKITSVTTRTLKG